MKTSRIPIKNFIFETEQDYLENKARKGYFLNRKGQFFYHFFEANPEDVTFQVTLEKQKVIENELSSWKKMAFQNVHYQHFAKVYYMTNDSDLRLMKDEKQIFDYYRYYENLFSTLMIFTLCPMLLILTLLIASIQVPLLIIILSLLLLIPFAIVTRFHAFAYNEIKKLNMEQGKLLGDEPHYILKLDIANIAKNNEVEVQLKSFGYVKKINETSYKIRSMIPREQLVHEIAALLEVKEEQIHLVQLGDLYLMP